MFDDVARDPEDLTLGAVMLTITTVLVVAAIVAGVIGMVPSCATPQEMPVTCELRLCPDDAAQMHEYGLPTKEDCIEFHLHGQWGYYRDGDLYAYDILPGGSDVWDDLYGIENSNAFHY